jgi:hypothetical protein
MPIESGPGDWVTHATRNARSRVDIVSPWLSEDTVAQLLSDLDDTVPLRVVFRWPEDASDAAQGNRILTRQAG